MELCIVTEHTLSHKGSAGMQDHPELKKTAEAKYHPKYYLTIHGIQLVEEVAY